MARSDFENLRVYRLAEELSDELWQIVQTWDGMSKHIVGRQLSRAADSIGANIAEGVGRGSFQDNRRFVRIARGSLYETKHWLRRAYCRSLVNEEQTTRIRRIIDSLAPQLNAYLKSIGAVQTPTMSQQINATDNGLLTTD